MIVDHAGRLYQRVADGGADEFESASPKIAAHRIRLGCARGHLGHGPPTILNWLAHHEAPKVSVEGPEFLAHIEKHFGVLNGGYDLQSIPHDPFVAQQPLHIARAVAGDLLWAKSIECFPIVFPFLQNGGPTQSRLRAFEDEKLKEQPIIVHRHAPFLIVITDVRFARSPRTAWHWPSMPECRCR